MCIKKTNNLLKIFDLGFLGRFYHTSGLEFWLSKTTFFAWVMIFSLEKRIVGVNLSSNSKYSTHTSLKIALKVNY
eukprot:UN01280